jgi:hypothetical protein
MHPGGNRVDSSLSLFSTAETDDASFRTGFRPRVRRGCLDSPRIGRGQEGLDRGEFRAGCNGTPACGWAGI